MKLCEKCKVEKPFEAFQPDKSIADGYAKVCRSCTGEYMVDFPETEKTGIRLPDLSDVGKEYGFSQSAMRKLGFGKCVDIWVKAGYKCRDCDNEHGLTYYHDKVEGKKLVLCQACTAKRVKNNKKAEK